MEFTAITMLCIALLSMMISLSCASLQIQLQSSHEQASREIQLSHPALPRKLRVLLEKVEVYEGQEESNSFDAKKGDVSGKSHQKKPSVMHGSSKGMTWHEWVEGSSDSSQFFTMDYSHVRRRRPIHNKALPLGP